MTGRDVVWGWVADQRVALADALAELPSEAWDRPSQCDGWLVRDAVGHLVFLAEATVSSAFADLARQWRPPPTAISRIARREGRTEPAVLLRRLRAAAGGRFVVPTQPPAVALGEVIVHGVDALRPVGGREPEVSAERSHEVAAAMRAIGPAYGTARAARRVCFTAADAAWSIGPDDGPAATGAAIDVLLVLAGRPEGLVGLTGPGTELLSG